MKGEALWHIRKITKESGLLLQKRIIKEKHKMEEDYKKKIIETIEGIEDVWILEQIYRCIKSIIKED